MEAYAPWLLIVAIVFAYFGVARIHSRLERTEAMLARLLDHLKVDFNVASEPSEMVKRLAAIPESRLEAIRAYRQQTGLGLKPAKAVIEQIASGNRADA